MTSKFIAGALAGAVTLSCLVVEQAHAVTVYTYTGNNFDAAFIIDGTPPAGTYDTSMRVTASFTVAAPLLPNADFDVIGAMNFSFRDGRNEITPANVAPGTFAHVYTDALGSIENWLLSIGSPGGPGFVGQTWVLIQTTGGDDFASTKICVTPSAIGCSGFFSDFAESRVRGTWTVAEIDTTPLPAALPLFATGLGALGLLGLRRKRRLSTSLISNEKLTG